MPSAAESWALRIRTGRPSQYDLAPVGLVDPGDALDEHGLAGAVVAAQCGDLSGGHVEVDVGQRLDGTEALVEAPHLQKGLVHARLGHLVTFVAAQTTPSVRPDAGPPPHKAAAVPHVTSGRCGYGVMPAALQTLVPTAVHSVDAEMNLSLITVDAMLAAFTHTGVSSDAGCAVPVTPLGGVVVEFTRAEGGVLPARRIVARATASWASW